ncbi:MAG TPA: SMP-30/gluconolactonase/LRE family protein [Levilinea sp.]|nr:SMP-30/gluconolactonase/LRE family protein [Levilinea sp.]
MHEVELVLIVKDELGEGPLWHPGEQALYWTDIEGRRYHRLDPASGAHEVIPVGERVGALGFRQSGGLVLATDHGFALFDPVARALTHLDDPEAGKPQTRFNDGAVDRAGRFWAGTLGDPENNHLYRLDPNGAIHRMDSGIDISNGIGWSLDDRTMYYIDSTRFVIYAYDFDLPSGAIANRRVFVDRSAKTGVPDGLIVDAEDFIWTAIWGGYCLERYDPAGKLERSISLPVEFPTSMAFGGPTLEDLYITSAQEAIPLPDRPNFPLAGNLFCIRRAGRGLAEPMFAG